MEQITVNVLMIDDSQEDFEAVRRLSHFDKQEESQPDRSDLRVAWAPTLEEAVEKLASDDYDAILLDYMIPGMDSIEALHVLVKIPPLTPTIMLTGVDSEITEKVAIESGAQDYLLKNQISLKALKDAIRRAIARLAAIRQGFAPGTLANPMLTDLTNLREMRKAAAVLAEK